MTFAWPFLLWLLAIPVVLLVWELTHRRRSGGLSRPKILRAEAGAHSLTLASAGAAASASSSSRNRPRYWFAAGLALAIVALARPQYGKLEEPVFDQSREILVAIDLSRSMLAPDVKPSRLDRAKLLIQSLLEKLEGERVGLVVFAGTSFLQSPLSADYEILREFLPALGPEFLPQGGSNYGALLDASLQAFSATNSADRFLVILSDGEATDEDWKNRIEKLKEKNVRVLGLGIGTPGGAMIPDGTGGFIKDERGAVVLSKLESTTLQELATATGGAYRDASGWLDVAGLVKETVEAGRKGQFLEKNTVRLAERFQWPLALGLWCLLVSFYAEFPVRPRPRDITLTAQPKSPMPAKTPTTSTAATVAALLFLTLVLRSPVFAAQPTPGVKSSPLPAAPAPAPGTPATSGPTPAPAPPPPSAALSKIIGRLATAESRTARDWAELGRESVTWGSRLQSEQQQIPEGPIRDALAAVDIGAKLDPKTADWPKLRQELEDLLKKSEEQKQEQQKQDDKDKQDQKDQQDKNQKDKDQKNQDQKKSDQQQSKDQQDQQQKSDEQKKQEQQQQKEKDEKEKQGESAFGDMKKNEQPPPPPPPDPGTQKVGGTPEKKPEDQQPADPALALPLQKLEQLRNQDSPAKLFQMMEGEKKASPKTKGKDW